MLVTILVVLLVLVLLGFLPQWPYAKNWGWTPAGIIGTVVIIILILWLLGIRP